MNQNANDLTRKQTMYVFGAQVDAHTKPPRYSSDQYNIRRRLYEILLSEISLSRDQPSKGVKVGDRLVYDMKKLFGRLLVISQKRDITLENMSYKLAPLPSSLFGEPRKSTMSKLVHKLAVYSEVAVAPDVDLVHGNEMLYQVVWPKLSGTDPNLFHNFLNAVEKDHDVIGVFDRYIEGSIKTHEHNRRAGGVVYILLVLSSARDAVMKSVHNKKDVIRVFSTSIALMVLT